MKNFKQEDIPVDVLWVWAVSLQEHIGTDTYTKIDNIIDRYPEWFEWEHKYKDIPRYIHDAYQSELSVDAKSYFDSIQKEDGGIMKQIKQLGIPTITKENFKEYFDDLFIKGPEEARAKQLEKEKKHEAVWNKHYKKYNLEYRKWR